MQIVDKTKFNGVFLLYHIIPIIGALSVFLFWVSENFWNGFVVSPFLINFALIWKRKI